MKKYFSGLITLLIAGLVHAQPINDPNVEVRTVSGYHGIEVSNAFNVYISQDGQEALAVSASDTKYRDHIKTEVVNGILKISYEQGTWNSGNKKLRAYISVKQLDKLTVSGACDVFIKGGLKADELQVVQSGASDLKGSGFDVQRLSVELSGASDMTISGSAARLKVEASGASDFKGFDLVTQYCDADASGASDIKITVNKELNVKASGASDVRYKGDALIRDMKTSGASGVSRSR